MDTLRQPSPQKDVPTIASNNCNPQEMERGMYFSDRCQFCHEFGENIEPYLCPDCKARILQLGYFRLSDDKTFSQLIKEAGYVKLREGEHISGVGSINIKPSVVDSQQL